MRPIASYRRFGAKPDKKIVDRSSGEPELMDLVGKGILKINVNHTYPLKDAVQAQRDLEARKTTGSIVLLP